tara:strand:- start:261 stop:914 length:654 start_codon:yes stop_codon:yes gene_type:complete
MSSNYQIQNINFRENLGRPSTDKGSVLVNDGTGLLNLVPPSNDCQVLTSDSTTPSGVRWNNSTQNSGFGFNTSSIPILSGDSNDTYYFMIDIATDPVPLVLPDSTAIFFSVTAMNDGWSASDPDFLLEGAAEFTIGYTNANAINIPASFNPYPGAPHLTVPYTSINSMAENYSTFSTPLNLTITRGQQVCVRLVSTLLAGFMIGSGMVSSFLLCVGR